LKVRYKEKKRKEINERSTETGYDISHLYVVWVKIKETDGE
jgi:hypothetical protein